MRASSDPVIPSMRLSTQEMDKNRTKGQCIWCDEKHTKDHQCPRRRQIYIMEMLDNEEAGLEDVEKLPTIEIEIEELWES